MTTNIIMLARDRGRLTYQALRTLAQTTRPDEFTLTLIDDESILPIEEKGWVKSLFPTNGTLLRISNSQHITGQARNLGIYWSERYWGRGDWLYLSDNDVAFKPGWLSALTSTLSDTSIVKLLGGYRHPYHLPNATIGAIHLANIVANDFVPVPTQSRDIEVVDAVAGYSQLMRWETWDKYGPLDANAPGVCQGEDNAFCRKIFEDGGGVGYVNPAVLSVCGITNTEGKPAVGWETFKREPGLIYE